LSPTSSSYCCFAITCVSAGLLDDADNYTEPIHGGLELESNPPYLMYTHGNDEVCCTCGVG
jgi:hypothetical protein